MKQLILLLTVAAVVGHSQAQGNRKCAANGEYCLTHSECCSGSCLSFSYKCVPVPPSASIGTTFVPVTVDTANRFGGEDGGASITQKTCAKNGEYCLTAQECCSGSCLSFSYKCVPVPGQPARPGETSSQQQPLPPQTSTTVDVGNRVGEGDQGSSSTVPVTHLTPPPPKKCAALGEYCLTSSECCSGSCLSFSYKCVTNPQLDVGFIQRPVSGGGGAGSSTADVGNRFGSGDSSKKCAAVGEYCLTSADCCSKSCLSFSYKCVQSYDLGSQVTQEGIPVQRPSVGGNVGTIETANRFGGSDSNRQCTANGLYCFHSGECCSGACFKSRCATEIKLGIPESDLTRPSPANGPYVQVNSLDELITRFGGGGPASDSSASASSRRGNLLVAGRADTEKHCAVVGEGCSRQEDCCSNRCHSYRRKCVT